MRQWILLGLGGASGVGVRQLCNLWGARLGSAFPVATLAVNVLGAFVAGLVYVFCVERGIFSETVRVAAMVGFLGGLTTFSTMSLEALLLFERGLYGLFLWYFLGSPLLGLGAAFAGMALGRWLT